MTLTGKQKRFLRSLAHHLNPIFQIGKGGVNSNLLQQVNDCLEARELIKVNVLKNCDEDKAAVAQALVDGTNAHLVQIIGNVIVLYKESKEKKQIFLPE
ncbi:ribosome assembly RNA-binding protein YhbY [Aeribacillus sp. FSL M8-0254]|uniref:ribosome assembly RNA-binding protein YhbY n=1 Tax=Aeribacillus sp. FSL M8-0254 TaxID=2954577 RepID=UPI0030F4FBCD